jgi:CheY-like chemotaxis protein
MPPFDPVEAPRELVPKGDSHAVGRRPTVGRRPELLIVDDEPSVLLLLEIALREAGFVVWPARGGAEAVRLYERHHGSIDLVLLDVQMPDLDGVQTLLRLQALDPHVRCCLMSGCTGRYSQEELLTLGVVRILPKPFGSITQLSTILWGLADSCEQGGTGKESRAD